MITWTLTKELVDGTDERLTPYTYLNERGETRVRVNLMASDLVATLKSVETRVPGAYPKEQFLIDMSNIWDDTILERGP